VRLQETAPPTSSAADEDWSTGICAVPGRFAANARRRHQVDPLEFGCPAGSTDRCHGHVVFCPVAAHHTHCHLHREVCVNDPQGHHHHAARQWLYALDRAWNCRPAPLYWRARIQATGHWTRNQSSVMKSAPGQSVPLPLLAPASALGCFADRRGDAEAAVFMSTRPSAGWTKLSGICGPCDR
jgi:hypothetical protein